MSSHIASKGPVLKTWTGMVNSVEVYVAKLPNDFLSLRVSAGGGRPDASAGFYLTYRGPEAEVLQLLETVLQAFKVSLGS